MNRKDCLCRPVFGALERGAGMMLSHQAAVGVDVSEHHVYSGKYIGACRSGESDRGDDHGVAWRQTRSTRGDIERSSATVAHDCISCADEIGQGLLKILDCGPRRQPIARQDLAYRIDIVIFDDMRSEEHTSELQSL